MNINEIKEKLQNLADNDPNKGEYRDGYLQALNDAVQVIEQFKFSERQQSENHQQEPAPKQLNIGGVMASAFVVNINHKHGIVAAKSKENVFDILRANKIEWNNITIYPIDFIYTHLP